MMRKRGGSHGVEVDNGDARRVRGERVELYG